MDTIEQLVTDNFRLCHYFAAKSSIDHDQCFSLAMDGLLSAAQEFQPGKGLPFYRYASMRIKWKIIEWCVKQKTKKRWTLEAPTHLDAEYLSTGRAISEIVADPQARIPGGDLAIADERRNMDRFMQHMSDRERYVIVRRFGLDGEPAGTLSGIGTEIGVTREMVRQIEKTALKKMRVKYGLQELLPLK